MGKKRFVVVYILEDDITWLSICKPLSRKKAERYLQIEKTVHPSRKLILVEIVK